TFERLHQIGRERLLQERGHRPVRLELAGAYRLAVASIADNDFRQTLLEIVEIPGETEDRHHLRGYGDIEPVLAREPVGDAAERGDDRPQRAIIHVHHPPPRDAPTVNAERIAPIDVIVDQRGEQVVRGADGMEIAGEMQINVLHRHDLGIAAAGGPALDAEAWAERGLANTQHRLFAEIIESIG